ncbi:MAG TPA: polysaccharide deacetylase family protein [Thermaerobacter sp.]
MTKPVTRKALRWLAASLAVLVLGAVVVTWHAAAVPVHYQDRVAVLLYHAFDVPADGPITVTSKQFDEHLRTLKAAGFQFITPDQFRSWKMGKGKVPPNAVLVTIDDGMKEIRSVAMPILRKHEAPAIAFVVYRRIDRAPNTLTSQDLYELERNGIQVQSHTYNMHYRVIRKSDGADVAAVWVMSEKEIREDMALARQAHHSWFDGDPDMLAYPYGAYKPEFIKAAQAEGIRYAFTTKSGLVARNTPNMELPRLNAGVRGMTGKQVVDLILKYAGAGSSKKAPPPKPQPKPAGYYVGGGLYRSYNDALKAAKKFTKATGYRMYVAKHPTHNGYWVQTGRVPDKGRAQYLARKWARLGIRYVVASSR